MKVTQNFQLGDSQSAEIRRKKIPLFLIFPRDI